MSELAVLQAVRLKGRVDAATVAACIGEPEDAAAKVLEDLAGREFVRGGPAYRITPEGKAQLDALVEAERPTIDGAELAAAYEEFDPINSAFKAVITDWQMRDATTPNDHTDADYDDGVLKRLARVDRRFTPVLERAVAAAPRLAPYPARFTKALAKIDEGDMTYVARPILDSYHTVWFEFHEDVINMLGLSRAEEAAAGRAE
jgi:pyruvate,orthophosphate dikinase